MLINVYVSRIATGLWGIFACVVAFYATHLGALIEVVNQFGSYFYGSLLGVFLLAISARRVSSGGAFYGLMVGVASVMLVDIFCDISFLWYNLIGVLVVTLFGILFFTKKEELDA